MKPLSACFLYAFVDIAYLAGRSVGTVTRQLCDGGADIIQLRAKNSKAEDIRRMAEEILPVTRATGLFRCWPYPRVSALRIRKCSAGHRLEHPLP